ncbi:DNA polymerase IV [Algivirga pacifica]|uniref:DNA polymerase IV n=2 Tax=Algivirga pacifica TaxID=1162670 RepID=A0ABP9DGD0_9BACT
MDAFYASVEQRDNPALRNKPIAVGGSSDRGVVAAASYEARKYGVHSAMSSVVAKRLCPDLIFTKGRYEVYAEVSRQIRAIFFEYTDLVEPLSLDEAYLDVTENKKHMKSAIAIARNIRSKIQSQLQLTASAGVSYNKFLAKTASDLDKPDGLSVILPEEAMSFLETLPIDKFYGIGKVTAEKMKRLGIFRGKELKMWPKSDLLHMFGKSGHYYYNIVRGIDHRMVTPQRERKSFGMERTFSEDITDFITLQEKLFQMGEQLWERFQKRQQQAKTLTLKIKYSDFHQITRSKTSLEVIPSLEEIKSMTTEMLAEFKEDDFQIRLTGISLSNLSYTDEKKEPQLTLRF